MRTTISSLLAVLLPLSLFAQSFPLEPGGGGGGGTGTVTSVGATSSSAALGITGSPIAVSGTFAFSLDADLTALAALTGTNTIYYRSADGVWSPVTFSGLTFSGGLLTATGGSGAPSSATYITQTADATLTNEQALGLLATGLLKNTTTTGVQSIAVAGTDYVAPTGSGAALIGLTFTQLGGTASDAQIPATIARDTEVAAAVAINATGFNGQLATTDDTIQEVAQKLDDLVGAGGDVTLAGVQTLTGAKTFDAPITINKNYIAPDEPMASTDIDTSEMHNTVSSAADVTLAFDTAPAAGAEFGVRLTNTDSSAHIWTIPSTYSEILGVPRTLLLIQPGVAYSLRFRHEGSGVYRMWGDPIDYADYPADVPTTTDTTIFYQTASGLYRRTTVDDLLSVYDTLAATLTNKNLTDSSNVLPGVAQIACSDMTTALTTGTTKAYWPVPYACTITEIRARVVTAPTGANIIVDINETGSGTLMTTNKLQIDATEKTSESAATPAVLTDTALDDDDEVTIDIDQIGSTVAGAGLVVTIFYTYSPH